MTALARIPAAALALVAMSSTAATFTVSHTADSGADSLRQALLDANDASGAHTIVFQLPADSSINVASDLPAITRGTVLVNGQGAPGLVISGGGNNGLFLLSSSNNVFAMSNLTVSGGRRGGGGGCLFAAPTSSSNASLSLINVAFIGCRGSEAGSPDGQLAFGGAARLADRSVLIQNSRFEQNRAAHSIAANAVHARGGALLLTTGGSQQVTISDSHFIDNEALSAADGTAVGGAIHLSGPIQLTVNGAVFSGNHSAGGSEATAGAMRIEGGANILVENSLFLNNHADYYSTLHATPSNGSRSLQVRNTSFVGNAGGGTVWSTYADVIVRNNSFVESIPSAPTWTQHLDLRANPDAASTQIQLSNNLLTPLADENDLLCSVVGVTAVVQSSNNQMAGRGQNCGPQQTATAAGLRLEAVRNHGGDVPTLALRAGSTAIDAGNPLPPLMTDPATCVTTDARGVVRPKDGNGDGQARCDVGAWESDGEASLFQDDFEAVLWRP